MGVMKTNTKLTRVRPVDIEKLFLFGALVVTLAAGCATRTAGVKAGPIRAAAELTGKGGPAEGRVTLRHLENFQLCAERNPDALPGLSRVEIEVGIDPAGRVLSSRVTTTAPKSDGLAACVARVLTWIEFERAAGTYRHYQLGLAKDADGRVLVDLTDLDAPADKRPAQVESAMSGLHLKAFAPLTGTALPPSGQPGASTGVSDRH